MGEDQRNLFIALGLIVVIMLGYDVFFMGPQREAREAEQAALEAAGEPVSYTHLTLPTILLV